MDSPIFLRIFASFDEVMQSVFCDSPRLISKNFIKFGDSSYFGIDFLKTKDKPLDGASWKQELFLQNI